MLMDLVVLADWLTLSVRKLPRLVWRVVWPTLTALRMTWIVYLGPVIFILYFGLGSHLMAAGLLPSSLHWHQLIPQIAQAIDELYMTYLVPDGCPLWGTVLGFVVLLVTVVVPIGCSIILAPLYTYGWSTRADRNKNDTHGSARWALDNELLRENLPGENVGAHAILGTLPSKKRKRGRSVGVQGHIVTCAPTGAGKGIGCAIPNLWTYRYSAVVLDLKGELVRHTAHVRREMGHQVFVVDPFAVTAGPYHAFNPMGRIDCRGSDAISEATQLADALVVRGGHGTDSYWDDAAADLLKGLILFIAERDGAGQSHLGTVREALTSEADILTSTLQHMTESDIVAIRRCGSSMLQKHEKEFASVLSTARRHTDFLDDACIEKTLERSDFAFFELKQKPITVYLVIPPHKLAIYRRFVRLIFAVALVDMTRGPSGTCPVLMLLDEFPKLGRMQSMEEGISILRSYGVQLWLFIQDLSQLQGVYPGWRTFLANATFHCFGTQDYDTANYISQMLGQKTQDVNSTQFGTSQSAGRQATWGTSQSTSEQRIARPLVSPDELRNMKDNEIIAFLQGSRPLRLERLDARSQLKSST